MSVNLYCARSSALMAVKTCSKALLVLDVGYGKSPCFSRYGVSAPVGVDYAVSVFAPVDVGKFSECAF